jgi:hypothetical protein
MIQMASLDRVVDELALRTLAARYALGVDDRDDVLFAATFLPDARLRVFRPGRALRDPVLDGVPL